jgi:hypothetical protein
MDLEATLPSWQWLLTWLGYREFQSWAEGISWKLGDTYVVLEQSRLPLDHDRRQAGLSHLAFHAGSRRDVDDMWQQAPAHGWTRLYEDRHPWAGGEPDSKSVGHYAAFLENDERFKVELVATAPE